MFTTGFTKVALKTELKPHQERVLKKLENTPGLLLYHGLGSGKTLSSIAATEGEPTDVVVPASLRTNYEKEVKLHAGKDHKPRVLSFEGYLKDKPRGKSLVVDEAHLAGRIDSARAKALVERAKEYDKRVLLTGTPIRNQPHEIAPLLRMARGDDKVPVDPQSFDRKFVEELTETPNILARMFLGRTPTTTYRIKNEKAFENLAKGYVDYFEPGKEGYPSVTEEVVNVPLRGDQLNYYNFLMGSLPAGLRHKIKSGLPPSKQEAKSLNTFLSGVRQVVNTASPFGGTGKDKIDLAVHELVKRRDKDKNFKALVYSNFLDAGVRPYSEALTERGIPHVVFDGSLTDKKRKEAVESYNKGQVKAILISGAGAQGLDLKGTKLVQILEPYWNTPKIDQAMGRAIRYKSHDHLPEKERKVHVQHFHATSEPGLLDKVTGNKDLTSDEYLDRLSQDKEKLNNQFLDVLKKVGR